MSGRSGRTPSTIVPAWPRGSRGKGPRTKKRVRALRERQREEAMLDRGGRQ